MKKLKDFWNQYKDYIQLDLLFYVAMFAIILLYAFVKFVV